MKLSPPAVRTIASSESLGGTDAALTVALFLGVGYVLDRWLGTSPWFLIGLFLLAAVGLFVKLRHGYEARMARLEAERREGASVRSTLR